MPKKYLVKYAIFSMINDDFVGSGETITESENIISAMIKAIDWIWDNDTLCDSRIDPRVTVTNCEPIQC